MGAMAGDGNAVVETGFEYRGPGSSVSLAGSWAGWEPQPMSRADGDSNAWALRVALPPGRATFKFVVDGKWIAAGEYPVEDDGHGGENCVLDIAFPKSVKEGGDETEAAKEGGEEQPGCVVM